jgi:hypothetical protein
MSLSGEKFTDLRARILSTTSWIKSLNGTRLLERVIDKIRPKKVILSFRQFKLTIFRKCEQLKVAIFKSEANPIKTITQFWSYGLFQRELNSNERHTNDESLNKKVFRTIQTKKKLKSLILRQTETFKL